MYFNDQGVFSGVWRLNSDVTLVARWVAVSYSINITADVEKGSAMASKTTAEAYEEIELTYIAKSGYKFKEWQILSGDIVIEDDKFSVVGETSTINIKAIFESLSYTISFNKDGGYGGLEELRVTYNNVVKNLFSSEVRR